MCVLSSSSSHINHHQSSNCSLSIHTHTHRVSAEGPLVCVSVKFPWQQIIQSIGMESQCEIPVVCGGLLLLNSHCPFERQAESLSVSLPCSAPRNCVTHSLPCCDTHTRNALLQKAWRRNSWEHNRNEIKRTTNRNTSRRLAWRSWLSQNLGTLRQPSPDRITLDVDRICFVLVYIRSWLKYHWLSSGQQLFIIFLIKY